MNRQRFIVASIGASLATVIAFAAAVLFVGNFTTRSLETTLVNPASLGGVSTFVVSTGAFWSAVLIIGATGGSVIGIIGYLVAREADPDGQQFPLSFLAPFAAVAGAVLGYAVMRSGIGAGGDIGDGEITISVSRLVAAILVAGIVAGAGTALSTHHLVRRSAFGFEGEAWPTSSRAFMAEATRAMMPPVAAIVAVFVFAVGLSRALLAYPGAGAVIIASLVAVAVLGGATALALRPWERPPASDGDADPA